MTRLFALKGLAIGLFTCALVFGTSTAQANTVVRFNTVLGSFDVELYDNAAPVTVQNFLGYVTRGDYDSSFFHRLARVPSASDPSGYEPFVLQGGAFAYSDVDGYSYVPTLAPIVNEFDPSRSNVRGTIAMAKTSDPNSATSQFFVNLRDNSASLDDPANSGGFTVFGHVIGNGMDVVDLLASQPSYDATGYYQNGAFGELPLVGYQQGNPVEPCLEIINSASVVPEPATIGLLCMGGLAVLKRKRK